MKKFSALFVAAAMALLGTMFAPQSAEAVPSFARQVGIPCYGCHFQHIPKLNSFGREFKLGGFTQASVDLIEDEDISIPAVANVSLILKYRYHKSSTKDKPTAGNESAGTDRGVFDLPDEVAFFIGGRIGDNFGFLTEGASTDTNNKFIYSADFGGFRGGAFVYVKN